MQYLSNVLLIFFLYVTIFNSQAQTDKDSIAIEKWRGAYVYKQGKENLTFGKLSGIVSMNPQSASEIVLAKHNRIGRKITFWPGAALVGVAIGGLLTGNGKIAVPAGGVGLVFIGFNYVYSKKEFRHTKKAIQLYNLSLKNDTQP